MAGLDLEWIAVFDEIYKTANVSRAADRLDMTQGGASTALNRLRAYFDDQLFCRTARGMLPTPRAEALYPMLREIREGLDKARDGRGSFVPMQANRTFRICMTDISEIVLLPALTNRLRREAPRVCIEVEKIAPDSPARLESGEVDLAVGFMPQLDAGFYQQVLFGQNFVCLTSADHPRIGKALSKAAYMREGHVLATTSGTGHAIVDKVLAELGVRRQIVLRVPTFLGLAQIVAETELLATVPSHYGKVMTERENVRLFPLPHALPDYDVKQHWHARYHRDPGNVWLRRLVAELLGGVGKPGKLVQA